MTRLLLALLLGLSLIGPATSHSWYTGKKDPVTGTSCCGGYDCAEAKTGAISEVEGGWLVEATGEIIEHERVQESYDYQFHRCVYLSGKKKGLTRCLFVPMAF